MLYNFDENEVVEFLESRLHHVMFQTAHKNLIFHSPANMIFTKLSVLVFHLTVLLSHYRFISLKSFRTVPCVAAVVFSEPAVHIVCACLNLLLPGDPLGILCVN